MQIPDLADTTRLDCDVLVIGGGTAGTMAALTAAEQGANVMLLEKAHVRHSGALAMGMDGVNNAVIPGKAEPEDYVAEITRANDGIVNQRTIYQTATRGFAMVQRLERYGVKLEKDEHGEYAVRRVHQGLRVVDPSVAVESLAVGTSPLTDREADVLRAAAGGGTVADIARDTFLSEGTVRNYLSSAMGKTGARTRAEAARIAQDNGWLLP